MIDNKLGFYCKSLLPAAVAVLLSGCAATATGSFRYETTAPKQAQKKVFVRVEDFKDVRPGAEKGLLGMGVTGLLSPQIAEPPTLLSDLKSNIENELTNAGYDVSADDKEITIAPTLEKLRFNTEVSGSNNTSINLRIHFSVREKGQEAIDHHYEAERKQYALGANSFSMIQDAMKHLVADFLKDMERYLQS